MENRYDADIYSKIVPVDLELVGCELEDVLGLELEEVEISEGAANEGPVRMLNEDSALENRVDEEVNLEILATPAISQDSAEEYAAQRAISNTLAQDSKKENPPKAAGYLCGLCSHHSTSQKDMISHMAKHRTTRQVCPICGLVLSSKNELELHLPVHKKEVPHVCSYCQHGFFRLLAFEKHKCTKKPLLCHYCNEVFRFKKPLKRHIKQCHSNQHPKKRYCHHCEFSCWSGTSLNEHLRTHVGNKTLHCPHCTFEFSKLESLKSHMRIHRNEATFTCPYCGSVFAKYGVAKIHMEVHKDRDLFSCSKCEFQTHSKVNLKVHSFRVHNPKKHCCPHCDYETGAIYRLRTHLLTHQDQKAKVHACTSCNYKTKYAWDLKRHVNTHDRELPYSCPHCDCKFPSLESLKSHASRHSELPLPDFLKL